MAFTNDQLQAIDDAIASGRLTVTYDERTVTYRSMNDLIAARNLVRSELIASGVMTERPGSNRGPASLAVFSRD